MIIHKVKKSYFITLLLILLPHYSGAFFEELYQVAKPLYFKSIEAYRRGIPDNIWMEVVHSWPMEQKQLIKRITEIQDHIIQIPKLYAELQEIGTLLQLNHDALYQPEKFNAALEDLKKQNPPKAKSLLALLSNPEEMQQVMTRFAKLQHELQRFDVNGISPIYEKTPLQYAIVEEDYEAALWLMYAAKLIQIGIVKPSKHPGQEITQEQQSLILPFITINPLAPSATGRTTIEYAFLALEKSTRPATLARHLEKKGSTYHEIMTYLTDSFAMQPFEISNTPQEKQALAGLLQESAAIFANLKQQFTTLEQQIDESIKQLTQLSQDPDQDEYSPSQLKFQLEQMQRIKLVTQNIMQSLHCAYTNIEKTQSLQKVVIAYRLVVSLLQSDLLKQANRLNLVLLNHWFHYYCKILLPHVAPAT